MTLWEPERACVFVQPAPAQKVMRGRLRELLKK